MDLMNRLIVSVVELLPKRVVKSVAMHYIAGEKLGDAIWLEGAYVEPKTLAFKNREEIRVNYLKLLRSVMWGSLRMMMSWCEGRINIFKT